MSFPSKNGGSVQFVMLICQRVPSFASWNHRLVDDGHGLLVSSGHEETDGLDHLMADISIANGIIKQLMAILDDFGGIATIYNADFSGLCKGISPPKYGLICYSTFILGSWKFPLIRHSLY